MQARRITPILACLLVAAAAAAVFTCDSAQARDADRINAIINELDPKQTVGKPRKPWGHTTTKRKSMRPDRRVLPEVPQEYDYESAVRSGAYSMTVNFRPGSIRIPSGARDALDDLGHALESRRLKGLKFLIIGHTDAVGSRASNQWLSERRARAVRDYLLAHFDIAPHRLVAIGFGEEYLADSRRPGARVNRRVEVAVLDAADVDVTGYRPYDEEYAVSRSVQSKWRYRH